MSRVSSVTRQVISGLWIWRLDLFGFSPGEATIIRYISNRTITVTINRAQNKVFRTLKLTGLSFLEASLIVPSCLVDETSITHCLNSQSITAVCQSQSQSYFTTGGLPPISSSWRRAPWDSRPEFFSQLNTCGHSPYITSSLMRLYVCHLQLLLVLVSAFLLGSDPWDSRPYFIISDSRLPFLSPPTTRRATVEVFDPASTQEYCWYLPGIPLGQSFAYWLENTYRNNWVFALVATTTRCYENKCLFQLTSSGCWLLCKCTENALRRKLLPI
jgi:hypothetical protein